MISPFCGDNHNIDVVSYHVFRTAGIIVKVSKILTCQRLVKSVERRLPPHGRAAPPPPGPSGRHKKSVYTSPAEISWPRELAAGRSVERDAAERGRWTRLPPPRELAAGGSRWTPLPPPGKLLVTDLGAATEGNR
jgi:hypothetical protein